MLGGLIVGQALAGEAKQSPDEQAMGMRRRFTPRKVRDKLSSLSWAGMDPGSGPPRSETVG